MDKRDVGQIDQMNKANDNLKILNISLPEPKAPVGAYVATKIVGKLLFISGQISIDDNGELSPVNKLLIDAVEYFKQKERLNKWKWLIESMN